MHLIAHALTYGTHTDVAVLRRYVSDDALRDSLAHLPPGVLDARSWAYWHLKLGADVTVAMPQRTLA